MILTERQGDLVTITLNRPDKANALTAAMIEELIAAVETAGNAKAIILTGAGKVFCAGADLDAAKAGLATSPLWEKLSGTIADQTSLTVAALNGTLAGGGFGMALACDLRLASPSARFFYPVMKLGFLPQPSDPIRMRALIGLAQTKRILMAGQKLDALTALQIGLIATPTHIAAIKEMI